MHIASTSVDVMLRVTATLRCPVLPMLAQDPAAAVPDGAGRHRRAALHRALGEPHRLAIVDALRLSDRSPTELALQVGLPSNLLAFHLGVLEDAGIVERAASEGDGRRRYARLRLDVLAELQPSTSFAAAEVLFVCTRNSARSPLAAALWWRRTGRSARSAGHDPAQEVHPLAVAVAREHGLDLRTTRPRHVDEVGLPRPDLVISVCDRAWEAGSPLDGPTLHWSVADPVQGDRSAFERAYQELDARVAALAAATEAAA